MSDPTFGMVTDAFKAGDAQLALTATHTFKGLTANLGLTKLYNISSEMVSLIRDGDYGAAAGTFPDLKAAYDEICGILKKDYFKNTPWNGSADSGESVERKN